MLVFLLFKKESESDYKLNYYVGKTDDNLNAISFESSCEIEKIIRVIAIDPKDRHIKRQAFACQ